MPYNPYLILKYNAHINVEVCSTVMAVKYLFQHAYKAPDRTCLETKNENDKNSTIS